MRNRQLSMFDPRVPDHDPGDIIGFTKLGSPIRLAGGGARNTYEAWIPEEFGSDVIQKVHQMSAIERWAQRVPMNTQTRSTPRSAGVGIGMVAKGGAYAEDTSVNDDVTLHVQKFGRAVRIAEEDIGDSLANIVNAKMIDWATAYAKALDNATMAVTAAKGTSGCAFDSLYYMLTQANASTGYSANANLTVSGSGGTSYAGLSTTIGQVESGDFFDEGEIMVFAHPSFKKKLRGILDLQNRPIFQESSNGVPGGGQGSSPDRIFGYQAHWSLGARTAAAPTSAPTGNPLMIVANAQLLLLGVRSGPESVFIDGRNGLAALTDESILKMRSRRGFALGHEGAVAIFEDSTGV